jgi:hypothetical protein
MVISDPPSIQYVLNDPELFVLPSFRKKVLGEVFGDGIFIANGELWKLQRSRMWYLSSEPSWSSQDVQ